MSHCWSSPHHHHDVLTHLRQGGPRRLCSPSPSLTHRSAPEKPQDPRHHPAPTSPWWNSLLLPRMWPSLPQQAPASPTAPRLQCHIPVTQKALLQLLSLSEYAPSPPHSHTELVWGVGGRPVFKGRQSPGMSLGSARTRGRGRGQGQCSVD